MHSLTLFGNVAVSMSHFTRQKKVIRIQPDTEPGLDLKTYYWDKKKTFTRNAKLKFGLSSIKSEKVHQTFCMVQKWSNVSKYQKKVQFDPYGQYGRLYGITTRRYRYTSAILDRTVIP